jgi:hypothetical protein
MLDAPDKKCASTEWRTPRYIVDAVRACLGSIALDPATWSHNPTGAARWYTVVEDGLHQPWADRTFVNPPFGSMINKWCAKLDAEAALRQRIAALLPCGARFSTNYFQQCVFTPHLSAICFIDHRVKFELPDGSPGPDKNIYDSAIYLYNVLPKDAVALRHLGKVLTVEVRNGF